MCDPDKEVEVISMVLVSDSFLGSIECLISLRFKMSVKDCIYNLSFNFQACPLVIGFLSRFPRAAW